MTTDEFIAFVDAQVEWFHGRLPETEESLARAERELGVSLPESMRWLLKTHGYWHGTGVSNLQESVQHTLAARAALHLEPRYLVLEDLGDAGCIVVDSGTEGSPGEPLVFWIDAHSLGPTPGLSGASRYESFGSYVESRLYDVREETADTDVRYDPERHEHRSGG